MFWICSYPRHRQCDTIIKANIIPLNDFVLWISATFSPAFSPERKNANNIDDIHRAKETHFTWKCVIKYIQHNSYILQIRNTDTMMKQSKKIISTGDTSWMIHVCSQNIWNYRRFYEEVFLKKWRIGRDLSSER